MNSGRPYGDAQQVGEGAVQELYWGAPRHIEVPKSSGHGFAARVTVLKDQVYPTLTFYGSARKDYTVSFVLAETVVEAPIKAGMTARQTAAAVAKAVNALDNDQMWNDIHAANETTKRKAIAFENPPDNAQVSASVRGATVKLNPELEY